MAPFTDAILKRRKAFATWEDGQVSTFRSQLLELRRKAKAKLDAFQRIADENGNLVDDGKTRARLVSALAEIDTALAATVEGMQQTLDEQKARAFDRSLSDLKEVYGNTKLGVSFDQVFYEQARYALAKDVIGLKPDSAFDGMRSWTQSRVKEILSGAVAHGKGVYETSNELTQALDIAEGAATRIVRTDLNASANDAHWEFIKSNPDVFIGGTWDSTLDSRTCGVCAKLHGTFYSLKQRPPGPPAHFNCFLAGTPVLAPGLRGGFVATYSGPIVEFGLADGRRLACTVNHMFLTARGFVCAKHLRKGDQILDGSLLQRAALRGPDDDGQPASIDEAVHALAKASGVCTVSVPVAAKDLHGDGAFCYGNVHHIRSHCDLRRNGQARRPESCAEVELAVADAMQRSLSGQRDRALNSLLYALAVATDGGMGVRHESAAFSGREAGHADAVCLASVPGGDACLRQSSPDDVAADTQPKGERQLRLAGHVAGNEQACVQLLPALVGCQSIALQDPEDRRVADAERLSDLLRGLSCLVATADVSFVRIRDFCGHVYDLQTDSSLYLANGLISSNCRCVLIPVLRDEQAQGLVEQSGRRARAYDLLGNQTTEDRVIAGQTGYEEWLKQQPAAVQRDILGSQLKQRYFERGVLKLNDVVTPANELRNDRETLRRLTALLPDDAEIAALAKMHRVNPVTKDTIEQEDARAARLMEQAQALGASPGLQAKLAQSAERGPVIAQLVKQKMDKLAATAAPKAPAIGPVKTEDEAEHRRLELVKSDLEYAVWKAQNDAKVRQLQSQIAGISKRGGDWWNDPLYKSVTDQVTAARREAASKKARVATEFFDRLKQPENQSARVQIYSAPENVHHSLRPAVEKHAAELASYLPRERSFRCEWQPADEGERDCAPPDSIRTHGKRLMDLHELGHHLEYEYDSIRTAAKAFRDSRATGKPVKLSTLTKKRYADDEVAVPGKFVDPYVGKVYKWGRTEVVSQGIEEMFRNPAAFAKKDPEHFRLILRILGGGI